MLATKLSKTVDFSGQNIYVGLDVHLSKWRVTILSEHLRLKSFEQPAGFEILYDHLINTYPGAELKVVFEAGFSGFWLQRLFAQNGVDCIVVNPGDVPSSHKEQLGKNDRIDSMRLASALRAGQLKGIYVPEEKMERLRALSRQRVLLSKRAVQTQNSIKSYLYYLGVSIPSNMDRRSKKYIEWLSQIEEKNGLSKFTLDQKINLLKYLRQEQMRLLKEIREILKEDQYAAVSKLLQSVPSIGPIIAFTLIAEVGDINRFANPKAFVSYLGLYPTESSSGEQIKKGRITPRRHAILRNLITEAAWVAARTDPSLQSYYGTLCKRMIPTKAITRIARKVIVRLYYVWKKNMPYEKMK